MNNRPIGMFDSGIGGINVYKQVKKALPNEKIIYFGDTKRFPYGNKTKEEIIQISRDNIEFLISKDVKCIIIACGTATSQALDVVSREYDIPIMGIIEPTTRYLKNVIKNETKIGVIATEGSIRSKQWENSLKKEVKDIKIISKATPLLANIVEEGSVDKEESKLIIREYMKDFKDVEKLILGCTHYPLFRRLIEEELNSDVEIIDIGEDIADSLNEFLKKGSMEKGNLKIEDDEIYLSDIEKNLEQYGKILFPGENFKIKGIKEDYNDTKVYKLEFLNKDNI